MAKTRTVMACRECRQQVSQWVGRCPGCGAWGTIDEVAGVAGAPRDRARRAVGALHAAVRPRPVASTRASQRLDRVLGGGLVPGSVALLAGEPGHRQVHAAAARRRQPRRRGPSVPPGIGRGIARAGRGAGRRRLGDRRRPVSFAPGRDLAAVLARSRRTKRPFLLAVDSIQALRDTSGTQMPGGVSQVRTVHRRARGPGEGARHRGAHDRARHEGRRPRRATGAWSMPSTWCCRSTATPVPGSGSCQRRQESLRRRRRERLVRDGAHGAAPRSTPRRSWSRASGCRGPPPRCPGRAAARSRSRSRRWSAATDGPARRQATGLDARRFQLVAAVLDRAAGVAAGSRRALRRLVGRRQGRRPRV